MDKQTSEQVRQKIQMQLLAGVSSSGESVVETVEAYVLSKSNRFELIRSPLFLRNIAAGDIFSLNDSEPASAQVRERSGKLCIRVFRKENIEELDLRLTPEVEKLDGSLDIQADKALVYSLHVNIGFSEVESLFDSMMSEFTDSAWYYGNIYDPKDGVTPLNWWHEFLQTV